MKPIVFAVDVGDRTIDVKLVGTSSPAERARREFEAGQVEREEFRMIVDGFFQLGGERYRFHDDPPDDADLGGEAG